jgi:hypothetical protein
VQGVLPMMPACLNSGSPETGLRGGRIVDVVVRDGALPKPKEDAAISAAEVERLLKMDLPALS